MKNYPWTLMHLSSTRYHSFFTNTKNLDRNTLPLMVIIVGPRGMSHTQSMQSLNQHLQILILAIKKTISNINNIAIKYTTCTLLYK